MIMIEKSPILQLDILTTTIFTDNRGDIFTTWQDQLIPHLKFVEDKISVSTFKVLRGLHGDTTTWKLVSCLFGRIQLVVVDIRPSNTYGQYESFYLDDQYRQSVLIPPLFLNGHLCLSDKCMFHYKQSHLYSGPENQISVRWDDPDLNIKWDITDIILSDRDKKADNLKGVIVNA